MNHIDQMRADRQIVLANHQKELRHKQACEAHAVAMFDLLEQLNVMSMDVNELLRKVREHE